MTLAVTLLSSPRLALNDSLGDNSDILGSRLRNSKNVLVAAPSGDLSLRWLCHTFILSGVSITTVCQVRQTTAGEGVRL